MEEDPAPAGWYRYPEMPGTQRYWDGEDWTDHVAPMPQRQAKPTGVLTVARGVALGIAAVIAGVALFWRMADAGDRRDCLTESSERVLSGQSSLPCD